MVPSLRLRMHRARLKSRSCPHDSLLVCTNRRRIPCPCAGRDVPATSGESENDEGATVDYGKSFGSTASVVGSLGLISKVMGVFREALIAGSFGVGAIADAFSFATSIPLLFLTSIGGLNGSLHSAIVAVMANRRGPEFEALVQMISTRVGVTLAGFAVVCSLGAEAITAVIAPGLDAATAVHAASILRVLAPIVLLSGWMGVSVGALVCKGDVVVPSLTPLIGNLGFIASMLAFKLAHAHGGTAFGPQQLAAAMLFSTVCQWLAQNWALRRNGVRAAVRWGRSAESRTCFRQVMAVAVPAALSSCALNFAAFTDLFFASFVPGAAASIGYALLIGMAPFGVISSSVLVPLLPMLTSSGTAKETIDRLHHIVSSLLCVTLPMAALMAALSDQLVFLMLSGKAFQAAEVRAVAALLPWVVLSALTGLLRDVVTRVYYARGRGRFPLGVSVLMIAANAALDWASVVHGYGAEGLLLATAATNALAVVLLCAGLRGETGASRALRGVLANAGIIMGMAGASAAAAVAVQAAMPATWVSLSSRLAAFSVCGVSTVAGIAVFGVLLSILKFSGLKRQRAKFMSMLPV